MRVTGADVLRYAQLRLKETAAPATINRELAALRAAYRLGLDNEVITAMPRIKLLPENNVRKGFAEAKQVETVCKRLKPDVADGTRFAFLTGWRRAEVFTLTCPRSIGAAASSGSSRARPRTGRAAPSRSRPPSA
jgi:integrase